MSFLKNKKIRKYFFVLLFLTGLAFLFFNEQGVVKYLKLKNEVTELDSQVKKVDDENKKLEGEIDSLQKKIPAKIERTAREKYNMQREGEKVIKIEEE